MSPPRRILEPPVSTPRVYPATARLLSPVRNWSFGVGEREVGGWGVLSQALNPTVQKYGLMVYVSGFVLFRVRAAKNRAAKNR